MTSENPHGASDRWSRDTMPPTVPVVLKKPKEYEEMMGGTGRETSFRPDRYRPPVLAPLVVAATAATGERGETVAFELYDVSQSGVALLWPDGVAPEVGTTVSALSVRADAYEMYAGEARVTSVREVDGGRTAVGLSFVDGLANIEQVLQLQRVRTLAPRVDSAMDVKSQPWFSPGGAAFKSLIAEFRLFIDNAAAEFAAIESELPWEVVHGESESAARQALIEMVRETFVPEALRFAYAIQTARETCAPEHDEALKQLSIRHLHARFMESPMMHRARHKPLGYAGDWQVMRQIYGREFDGPTLFARAMQLAMCSTAACEGVRNRKDVVKRQLSRLLDERRGPEPVRIVSIAAGPAQETYELLNERERIDAPVEIVLFDQDRSALNYAYARLKNLVDTRWGDRVKIAFRHDSIRRLLRDPEIFAGAGPFDAIICCGLFDYLNDRAATALTAGFHSNLASGGTAYIGNVFVVNPTRWLMEHHLDWEIIHRTHDDMLGFARAAAPGARLAMLEEPLGVNPIVAVTRP